MTLTKKSTKNVHATEHQAISTYVAFPWEIN